MGNRRSYHLRACQALGVELAEVGRPSLGMFRLIDTESAVDEVIALRLARARSTLLRVQPKGGTSDKWRNLVRKAFFLSFRNYLHAIREAKGALQRRDRQMADTVGSMFAYYDTKNIAEIAGWYFLERIYKGASHTPDRAGYFRYLREATPKFYRLLTEPISFTIPEHERAIHTYVVGSPGSGKTELLKLLVYSYITNHDRAAVVVIDPAGDFAQQVAQWREHAESDRLIYVDYDLAQEMVPTINPFEIPGVEPGDTSTRAVRAKQVVAQQLLEALEEIVAGGEKAEFTKNMKTVLLPCILALLDRPGATLLDLRRFMDDKQNGDLVAFGISLAHYPQTSDFFANSFRESRLNITKGSISTKLQDLFSTGIFAQLTCGKNTIDLEKAINRKRTIVFNLGKGKIGEHESKAFGQLVVALLQGIAMRRADLPEAERIPCHVFIDECHNFISPSIKTIMTETRKYKVILTLAQQTVGDGMSPAIRNAVLGCANVQFGGSTNPPFRRSTAELFPVEPDAIGALKNKEFYARTGRAKRPFKLTTEELLAEDRNSMTSEAWERLKARLCVYYRRCDDASAATVQEESVRRPHRRRELI